MSVTIFIKTSFMEKKIMINDLNTMIRNSRIFKTFRELLDGAKQLLMIFAWVHHCCEAPFKN